MKNKVSVNRYNVMEAMEKVVQSRGYGTVAQGSMFRDGEAYCLVGSVVVEMNAETKNQFSGGMDGLAALFREGYFEWADETEADVVTHVLADAMNRNDGGMTFGENLSRCREQMRALAIHHPASEAIKVIANRVEAAHFLSQATATV